MNTPESISLNIAILTISDSRTKDNDTSGDYLVSALEKSVHSLASRQLVNDNRYAIRAVVSNWIADEAINGIISTGGTGLTGRDGTPEAIAPLLDKRIDGFGEMFRNLSYQDIGTATLQSRAIAGVANATFIFCVPGSTGACRTAWEELIQLQLDSQTKPCNLTNLKPRLRET